MNKAIPPDLLARLSDSIAARFGLHFPTGRLSELAVRFSAAAADLGFSDPTSLIGELFSSTLTEEQSAIIARHLTVGETYFFREPGSFEALENHVLPELIVLRRQSSQRLRIWCAGCSTGEEAYSVAALLRKLIPDIGRWNIEILATDINPLSLQKAIKGVYTQWSFRNVPEDLRRTFCRRTGKGEFEVLPEIRNMVTFARHNLVSDKRPSSMSCVAAVDMIFCRNVLMYFVPDAIRKAVSGFHRSLNEEGWLLLSPAESSLADGCGFSPVSFPGAVLYRKTSASPAALRLIPESLPPVCSVTRYEPPLPGATVDARSLLPPLPVSFQWKEIAPEIPEAPKTDARTEEPDLYPAALGLYRESRLQDAEETLLRLISSIPDHPAARALIARIYANQGKLQAALESAEEALRLDRLKPGAHYLMATILDEMDRTDEARSSLERALYLDPDFIVAHFALGNIALREGRQAEAKKRFDIVALLSGRRLPDEPIPESDGMTAGSIAKIVASLGAKPGERPRTTNWEGS